MRQHAPKQMPMPFDHEVPAVVLPVQTTQALVQALADLVLATVSEAEDDEERDDAREGKIYTAFSDEELRDTRDMPSSSL